MQQAEAATFERKSGGAERSAVRHSGAPPLPSHLPHRPPNEASATIGLVTLDLQVDSGKAIVGLLPHFGPRTLGRTWGTRPISCNPAVKDALGFAVIAATFRTIDGWRTKGGSLGSLA
jgi:hypothetical protein